MLKPRNISNYKVIPRANPLCNNLDHAIIVIDKLFFLFGITLPNKIQLYIIKLIEL